MPALGVAQGGFLPNAWVWGGVLPAWAAAVALVLRDRPGALRRAWVWLACGLGLLGWTLASALWSVEPAQSILEARRTVVYVAFALALVVLAQRLPTQTLVAATHAAISVLIVYSLARYLLEARVPHYPEGYLLSQPLGYSNAVGILAAIGALLALERTVGGGSRWTRAAAAASVPLLLLAVELSRSRASWLAFALGVATLVVLHSAPLVFLRPVTALLPPVAVLLWVGHHSALATAATPRWSGSLVAVVSLGAAAIAAGAGVLRPPTTLRTRRVPHRWLVIAALCGSAAAAAAWVARSNGGDPRSAYFRVAWHEYLGHPLLGSGAGTFGRFWVLSGLSAKWGGALDAHSLYLEILAELGPIGLLLLLGFLLYPVLRLRSSLSVPGVPAAAAATLAFLVHSGLDWDWEMPAVVTAGLACA
ncbi:MAG TPA: hypothetical protein VE261_00830, partial [Gaiellaceae bacterium]|nr:hypothetical protein [Gaiellaceae bacterium]